MEKFSRRRFLQQAGTGLAAVSAVSAVSGIPGARSALLPTRDVEPEPPNAPAHDGPLVVHIPDTRSGRIHLMFGTEEVVHQDPGLVARLIHATR